MDNLNKNFFSYKDKPLVKKGNTIYYGSMLDEYVIMMQVLDTIKNEDKTELSNKILVQLMRTDTTINPQEIIVKKSEKIGIYSALEIADIWLTRALS